jgi:hypothetical protein
MYVEGLRKTKKITAVQSHVGARGRLIIQLPLNLIFFEHFRPRIGLKNVFEGACPNC